ncbi:huntingtin-interacting protein 1 isoform X2 [Manduca sexta]|uniref:huntingtin-interacting protein 1 isoform X2 n=1 Tax=Manduca sexta TaxID=7130 RepID=UPI00189054B8|nr:huntingtin-interacting protein 1 isoform X2 [Manduca sexta]XP_037294302.1 huntingtin-interacting protein 1 isoform X2 [Manduca sexta]
MATPHDKRFYQLTLAIQKAINAIETPVKEKHVRSTIIGTFQEQSAVTYWMVAIRQPLQENRIVAWKFCHVTHKLLREGHPACLDDSQRHIGMIENLGKLWVHLREGYGKLVHLYCNLLVCKLKFHARNPRFPGNMLLTADELDAIAENDVNNYFQLCVELFDYMDEILNLQAAVFDSLGNARANSMTASGQCRLAALIPCAQDASQLYDCNVRLLFRLHAALPPDTLAGHRERFRQQFRKLSSFYKHASSLQYYRNLLTLPVLPSNPPNFLLQSDFGTYVTPVVSIPEQPPDEVDTVGSLIDTSDTLSQSTFDHFEDLDTRPTPSPQPDPIVERDRLIDHLQNELKRMRTEVAQLVQERNSMLGSMREHCNRLETQLQSAKTELEEERQKAEMLSVQTPEIKKKLTETEEKAKVTDEKFQKLKGAYTQLREEHITLIRQKAEVDKLSANLRAAAAQHESAKTALQQQLHDKMKDVELLQQSASSSEEIEAYKSEISNLRADLEQSRQTEVELQTLKASMEALEIEHKTAKTEQVEKLTTVSNELKEAKELLEKIKQEKEEQQLELTRVKEELVGLRQKSGDDYKKAVEEKEEALKRVANLTEEHTKEKEELTQWTRESVDKLKIELENLQQTLTETETNHITHCDNLHREVTNKNQEFEEILRKKDIEVKTALDQLAGLQTEYEKCKESYETQIKDKDSTIEKLEEEIADFININEMLTADLGSERDNIEQNLKDKILEVAKLERKVVEIENIKNEEIAQLKKALQTEVAEKNEKLNELNTILEDKNVFINNQKSQYEQLLENISQLDASINERNIQIETLNSKLNDAQKNLDDQIRQYEDKLKESHYEIKVLNDKLQNVTECKDEIISNLKGIVSEKDEQVITLNIEATKLAKDVARLTEELTEAQAELEIGKNEFITLREEHDDIVEINVSNITMKNKELRSLHEQIQDLGDRRNTLEKEREKLIQEFSVEKQVFENKILEVESAHSKLYSDFENYKNEQELMTSQLNTQLESLTMDYEQLKLEKETEVKALQNTIETLEANSSEKMSEKDCTIIEAHKTIDLLKAEINELKQVKATEIQEFANITSERDREKQLMESRFERAEEKRLNAESELQDLLQHNSVLEADLVDVKRQLLEAQEQLEKQRLAIVSCASDAALEIMNEALAALERSNAQETNKAAAKLAATSLKGLSRHTEVKGNEESIAKATIFVAHSTAQLSAYVTEVSHISTDIELSDKLNNECRSMLNSTKQCLESVRGGSVQTAQCGEASALVADVSRAACAADRLAAGARSVDDELADMDAAIEDAAEQIEELLAASRAGDSGVKLEVNSKILDACTTLMGAVKVLVQDARKLQNELGDPHTRQKMYRKNPQWSEGLISAAKAVVFAAKLLVTSADEAVGAAGRVEGVSAAAHEVAGSTAQLVAASRARAPPQTPALARLTQASRDVAAATGAVVAAVRAGSALVRDHDALDTSALTLTATRRLEMESKVRSLELESALDAERARLAALRKRHYQLAQQEENGNMTNGKQ